MQHTSLCLRAPQVAERELAYDAAIQVLEYAGWDWQRTGAFSRPSPHLISAWRARECVQESDALRRKLDDDLRAKDQRISQLSAELDASKQVRTTRGRPSGTNFK